MVSKLAQIHVLETRGILDKSSLHSHTASQLAKQLNSEQQLSLRGSVSCTSAFPASQPQPKQTGPSDLGVFSVKSLYLDLMNEHTPFLRKYLWKLKIPLKIKNFIWFLNNKVLLTKDNLAKPNWCGCQRCYFSDSNETVERIFSNCPFSQIVWCMLYWSYNIPPAMKYY
jgi:hypothetical protein